MARSYNAQTFTVTGTGYFVYSSFNNGISAFTIKNGAQPVNLFLGDVDKPLIPVAANEVYTFYGPFDQIALQATVSTNSSSATVVEFPHYL